MKVRQVSPQARATASDIRRFFIEIFSWQLTGWEKFFLAILIIGRIPSEPIAVLLGKLQVNLLVTILILILYSIIIFLTELYYTESIINKTSLKDKRWVQILRVNHQAGRQFVKYISPLGWFGLLAIASLPTGTLIASAVYSLTRIRYGVAAIILGNVFKIYYCYQIGA